MTSLLVTDLDGSLWGPELVCHPNTLAAMAELERRGVPVLVATGRRETSAKEALEANSLSFPAVLLNGSLGVELESGHRFHERGFAHEHVWEVIGLLASVGISPLVYTSSGHVRHNGRPTTADAHVRSTHVDYIEGSPEPHETVVGFSMLGMRRSELERGVQLLGESEIAQATFYEDHLYNGWSLMVQPAGISKQIGIQAYLQHANLEPERVVAVGDGGNDLEMLAAADVAVGCAGGDERALALADLVVPHPDEGGWAEILELF